MAPLADREVVEIPDEITIPTAWVVEARRAVWQTLLELDAVYTDRDEHWAQAKQQAQEAFAALRDCLDPKNQLPF